MLKLLCTTTTPPLPRVANFNRLTLFRFLSLAASLRSHGTGYLEHYLVHSLDHNRTAALLQMRGAANKRQSSTEIALSWSVVGWGNDLCYQLQSLRALEWVGRRAERGV
jgi:hypothetical protein